MYFVREKYVLAKLMGLTESSSLSILDIGCGGGHFELVCRRLGHQVMGIDVDFPILQDIADALGSKRTIMRVEPTAPLPNFDRKIDLVTALGVSFHFVRCPMDRRHTWSLEEWIYLLDDVINRQLRFPGRIFLRLNRNFRDGEYVPNTEVPEFCVAHGAKIVRGNIDWQLAEPIRLR